MQLFPGNIAKSKTSEDNSALFPTNSYRGSHYSEF